MDNSRFPVEICEHIIDSLDDSDDRYCWKIRYSTVHWCRTALVCSAWLPRSRFNLYRTVHLKSSNEGNLLLRTLEKNFHLVPLVVELFVGSLEHMPLLQLARLLKNCIILHLDIIGWDDYPPRFADTCLYPFSLLGIVNLTLTVAESTGRSLLRFIHSLTMLEELSIRGDRNAAGLWGMGPIAALGARRLQNGKPAALSNLKKLKLEQDTVCIKFPRNYFGDAVVHLHLNLYFQISTELLQCIQNLHRLQTLDIKLYSQYSDDADDLPFRTKISTLPSILTSVSSGSALHALSISCYPASPPNILWSYCLGRSSLLDILVGADMRKVLNGFPSLSKLIFKLFENDEGYDNVWWKEEMVRRLPSHLQAAVMIELLQMDFNSYLWLSMHEIRTRHTQKNPIDISIIKNGLALAFNNPSPLLPQLDQIDEDEDEEEEEEEDEDDEEKDTLKQQSTGSHPQQTHPSPTPEYLSWAIDEDLGGKTLDAEHWSDSRFLHADNLGETVSHVPHSELPLSTYSEIAAALEPYH